MQAALRVLKTRNSRVKMSFLDVFLVPCLISAELYIPGLFFFFLFYVLFQ